MTVRRISYHKFIKIRIFFGLAPAFDNFIINFRFRYFWFYLVIFDIFVQKEVVENPFKRMNLFRLLSHYGNNLIMLFNGSVVETGEFIG